MYEKCVLGSQECVSTNIFNFRPSPAIFRPICQIIKNYEKSWKMRFLQKIDFLKNPSYDFRWWYMAGNVFLGPSKVIWSRFTTFTSILEHFLENRFFSIFDTKIFFVIFVDAEIQNLADFRWNFSRNVFYDIISLPEKKCQQ